MKLVLSPYRPEFLSAIHRWRQEEASLRFNPLSVVSIEETARGMEQEASSLENLSLAYRYRWFLLREGRPVGTVSLQAINLYMGYAEIGYMVGEEFYNRGIASAGLRLFLRELFTRTKLRRLVALVHEENLASRRVMEKVGFTYEGILREHYLIRGRPVNEVHYGLLRREWEELLTGPLGC